MELSYSSPEVGRSDGRPFRAADWKKAQPLPERREAFASDRVLTTAEVDALRPGVRPGSMDDRWFFWAEALGGETLRLHMHRSWTGQCIFVARVERAAEGWCVARVEANADPAQVRFRPGEAAEVFSDVLDLWLDCARRYTGG